MKTHDTQQNETKSPSSSNLAPSALSMLPDDQRQQVLSYLTCYDLLTLTLVSKGVKNIALKSHTLVAFNNDDDNNDEQCVMNMNMSMGGRSVDSDNCGSNPILRRSILNGSNTHLQQRRWAVSSTTSMFRQHLLSAACIISERNLNNLLQKFQSLRVLKLYNLTSTNESFIQIVNSCPAAKTLTHVEFHHVRLVNDHYSLNLQQHPNKNNDNHDNIYNNNNLEHVTLSGTIFSPYDKVIKSFCTSNKLQYLTIDGCRSITDENIQDLSKVLFERNQCQLQHLSLKNSSKIIHPRIQTIIRNDNSNRNSSRSNNSTKASLASLNLSQCPMLQDLSSIRCPNLQYIDVSNCSSINDTSIQSLLLNCPRIEKLNICGCSSLSALDINTSMSKCLKELDMNLCVGLVSLNLHCDRLSLLELGFCQKLVNVRLDLPNIKSLDLSMLGVKDFFLHASKLSNLNLSGCFELNNDSVYLNCPYLRNLDISGSNLGLDFEQEYLHGFNSGTAISGGSGSSGRKVNVLKGGTAHDWMSFS